MLPRIITVLGALIAARELSWSGLFHQDRRLLDFRIFWCGGRVAVDGGNPDTVGQLPVCEHQHATPFMHASPNLVMPFVLPPFDLVPFDLFARLPYGATRIVYAVLCRAAVGGAIVLVAKSTQVPLPVPFEVVALAATGLALNARRDRIGGAWAALTLMEPNIGVFVIVALFVLVPATRITLTLGTLALLALGVAMIGPDVASSYLGSLSQHAAAKVARTSSTASPIW